MSKCALLLYAFFLISGCRTSEVHLSSVRNNVCKVLEKKVVLYAVFVDSEHTHPWSEFDIRSTIDSMYVAKCWLEEQAQKAGKALEIEIVIAISKQADSIIPVRENFKFKTLTATLFHYRNLAKGIKLVDEWADKVSREIGKSFAITKFNLINTRNNLSDRERLIAAVRNEHGTDNVALLFFTNHYFENEMSVALHTGVSTTTEYAIVSEKQPAIIAHEFLHLFGAWDLYITPFDRKMTDRWRKRRAMRRYPNEIMAFAYRRLDTLNISPLTKYLIGWDNQLDHGEGRMFLRRKWRPVVY